MYCLKPLFMKTQEYCSNLPVVFHGRKKLGIDCEVVRIAYPFLLCKAEQDVLVPRLVVLEGKAEIHFVRGIGEVVDVRD